MPTVQLKSGSLFDTGVLANPGTMAIAGGYRDRLSLIVYEGKFAASTGDVTVTVEDLKRLVETHNARVKTFGANIMKCPPIQLDHSRSANDTVGRLIGELQLGEHTLDDGTKVVAVLGVARFLGKENVEKADDGRYGSLSISADFSTGHVFELTVTPFPAAAEASLLSADPDKSKGDPPMWDDEKKAKLKAYLTGVKKMSESDADQYVSKCAADKGEGEKLSAEVDEHEKKEKEESEKKDAELKAAALKAAQDAKVTQLTAAKASIVELSTKFDTAIKNARLAAARGTIATRFSRLRAQAKITPAEIKKTNIDELAASTPAEIEAVMKSYENREPVILVGQLGTIKALSLADIGQKKKNADTKQLESQILANMPSLAGAARDAKLAELKQAEQDAKTPQIRIDNDPDLNVAYFSAEYEKLCKLMETDVAAAKLQLKGWLTKVSTLAGSDDHADSGSVDAQAQIAALAKTVEELHTGFSELKNITTQLANS